MICVGDRVVISTTRLCITGVVTLALPHSDTYNLDVFEVEFDEPVKGYPTQRAFVYRRAVSKVQKNIYDIAKEKYDGLLTKGR